jgi:hypothetical protein
MGADTTRTALAPQPRTDVAPARPAMRVTDFRPHQKNTLVGFVRIEHASGLVLHEVGIHCRDGKWWASPPARPILINGVHALDDNGKARWQPLVDFRSREIRNNWSQAVVAAFLASFGDAS